MQPAENAAIGVVPLVGEHEGMFLVKLLASLARPPVTESTSVEKIHV